MTIKPRFRAVDDAQTRLLYTPLDGLPPRVFVLPSALTFHDGRWSADGQLFAYSATDESIQASYLYLWRPETGPPELIYAAADEQPFSNFVWRGDGSELFCNLGSRELLKFIPATGVVETIVP